MNIVKIESLTDEERVVLDHLKAALDAFSQLPPTTERPDEGLGLRFSIYEATTSLSLRAVRRNQVKSDD